MADIRLRPAAEMAGIPQSVLAEEAFAQRTHPRQEAMRYLRRALKATICGLSNIPLRTGTGANVSTGVGMPGIQTIAGGATHQIRLYFTGPDGRAPLAGGVGELTAVQAADGRDLNPRGWIFAPNSMVINLTAGAGAGQALTRLNGAAVPRAADEQGYRFVTGLGLVTGGGGGGPNLSTVNGCLSLDIVMALGGVNTPAGDYEVYGAVEANPIYGAGVFMIPYTIT